MTAPPPAPPPAPAGFGPPPPAPAALAAKRLLDLAAALPGVVLLAAPLLLLALVLRLRRGGPLLERSPAVGRDGRPFLLLRLPGPLPAPLRPLPQLLNVLAGDMSLVGPRPLGREEAANGGAALRRRGAVRPGMTGWAQINRAEVATRQQRLDLDLWYVEHWSLRLDLYILGAALRAAFRRLAGGGRRG